MARLDFDLQGLTGTLNLSGLAGLEQLACYNNQLTALNLSGLSKLKRVYAYNNRLTALNISGLADLTFLDCEDNQLTALNLSALPKLDALACSGNKLSSLNLSGLSSLRELSCSDNQLTALNLTGLSALSSLYGINQTASLTMAWNPATQKYEAAIALNNPTNLFNGLSYANGKLIANNNSVASTNFTVETGLPGKTLSGTLQLTYNTGSANEAAAIPPLKAVSHNGTLTVSGLNVGDDLKVYNISGILIYNVRKTEAAEVRVDIELGVYVVVSGDRRIKVLAR